MTNINAINYIKDLEISNNLNKDLFESTSFKFKLDEIRNGLSNDYKSLVDIMMNLLNFNPYFRTTAYDMLKNCKIFDSVRNRHKESVLDYINK